MPPITLSTVLQVLVAFGLLNVWLLRSAMATNYRGGEARTLKEEFAVYGLPVSVFYLVGVLKIGSAVALLAGLWLPVLVRPAAGIVVILMLGALRMHIKVQDPLAKCLPALIMLLLSGALAAIGAA